MDRARRTNWILSIGNVLLLGAHVACGLPRGGKERASGNAAAPAEPMQSAPAPVQETPAAAGASTAPAAAEAPAPARPASASVAPAAVCEPAVETASVLETEPVATSGFRIQVGSFRSIENARALAEDLAARGSVAEIREHRLGQATWFRVTVGPFATLRAARAALGALLEVGACETAYVCGLSRGETPDVAAVPEATAVAEAAQETEMAGAAETLTAAARIDASPAPEFGVAMAEALPADPAGIEQEFEYAMAREARGDAAEALAGYRRVLDRDPNHYAARNRAVTLYLAAGRLTEAESEMYLLQDVAAADPLYIFNTALLAYARQRYRDAHLALVRVLDAAPDDTRARLLLGNVFEAQGDLERALVEIRHAHRTAPEDPSASYALARALDHAGQRDAALAAYEAFLAQAPAGGPWAAVCGAVRDRLEWLRGS